MAEWVAFAFLIAGVGFFAAGSIGLLRLPDLHSRLHALTKADNLGLGLLVVGLALLDGGLVKGIKLFLIWRWRRRRSARAFPERCCCWHCATIRARRPVMGLQPAPLLG